MQKEKSLSQNNLGIPSLTKLTTILIKEVRYIYRIPQTRLQGTL